MDNTELMREISEWPATGNDFPGEYVGHWGTYEQ